MQNTYFKVTLCGIALVAMVVAFTLLGKAAGPYWQSTFGYNVSQEKVTYTFNVPAADAQLYNQRIGANELKAMLDQSMNKVRNQISDWKDQSYQRGARLLREQNGDDFKFSRNEALAADELYQDTVGTFLRTHPIIP